jgi:transposase
VTEFFFNNSVETLPWPPQSPDMNPIENLWAIIKARLMKKFPIPRTRDEWIDQVFAIWDEIGPKIYEILSDFIFHRLYEVSRRNGRQTKF